MKEIDLTNQVFGRLTVIRKSEQRTNGGTALWECECSCSAKTKRYVSSENLRNGKSTHCGCVKKGSKIGKGSRTIDLTNRTFGSLTVKHRVENTTIGKKRIIQVAQWFCVCSCGGSRVCPAPRLLNGSIKGCPECRKNRIRSTHRKRLIQIGDKIGHFTIIAEVDNEIRPTRKSQADLLWLCECICLNKVVRTTTELIRKESTHCGCLTGETHKTHGDTAKGGDKSLYRKYTFLKEQCYNSSHIKYPTVGGRGIKVCDEWLNSYEAFKKWAYTTGYYSGTPLMLTRDNLDGDFTPENCRWATITEIRRMTVLHAHTLDSLRKEDELRRRKCDDSI
jgi:hypothetical protein